MARLQYDIDVDARRAEQSVGAFATSMRKQIEQAIRALPDIALDANSSAAQREIAEIRQELVALSRQRIGIDIDPADAQRRLSELAGQLHALSTSANDIQVRADTAAASIALRGIDAEASRLDGRHVSIKFDVDKSLAATISGIGQLGRALRAVADPSHIPIIERVSDAISNKFHQAVNVASVGVDKLDVGLRGLRNSLIAVGAAGNAVQVLGGAASALSQIAPAALLIPGALAAVGVAFAVGKLAATGFSDALTGSAKKQHEAFAAMGPEAQKLVTTLKSLGPAANSFRKAIQDATVKGFSEDVKRLAGQYLPMLRPQLVGIASELNATGRGLAATFSSTRVQSQFANVIQNIRWSLTGIAPAAGDAAAGVIRLAEFGSRYLLGFGRSVSDVAARFRDWIEKTTGNGQMKAWIDNAVRGFKDLWTIVKNVASIIGTVFQAFSMSGGSALDTAARLTAQIKLFLQSAEGQSALRSLADTVRVVGDNLSKVLGAALRVVAPLLVALGPAAQALANALGDHLTHVIEALAPLLTRLAAALSENPELVSRLAQAALFLSVAFQPAVAIIGVMASILQGLLIARIASLALGALGQSGTVLGRVLMAIASPMTALREALPLIARGIGYLAASLGIAAGPIGVLIIAFATLYASSSQFRDAINGLGQVILGLFVRALQQAGQVLNGTIRFLSDFADGVGIALGGLRDFGSTIASSFGPAGKFIGDVLTGIFNSLSILPGAALAAFAAFKVLGLLAPIFTGASVAVTAFAARLAAVQMSSGIMQGAVNGSAAAVGAFGTALSKVGAALPLIGVAVIALGAAYSEFGSKAEEIADKQISGQLSMAEALEATRAQVDKNLLFEVRSGQQAEMNAQAEGDYRAELEKRIAALPLLEQLQARVTMAQTELNDAVVQFGPNSVEAANAAANYQSAQTRLAAAQDSAKTAAQSHSEAIIEQRRVLEGAVDADIKYQDSLDRLAQAQDRAAEAVKAHGAGSREAEAAIRQTTLAALDAAKAAGDKAQADAVAAGAANADEIASRAQKDELLRLAAAASGPTKAALLDAANGTNSLERAQATAEIQARLHKDELGRLAGEANGPLRNAINDARNGFDTLGGAHATAQQKAQAQKDELQRLANMASGPVKASLQAMADQVKTLPDGDFNITATGVTAYKFTSTGEVLGSGKTGLATGGVLPGYTPGRDVQRFRAANGSTLDLSGGESIMRPEWTRAVSPAYVNAANAAARTGGVAGVQDFVARTSPRRGHGEGFSGDGNKFSSGGIFGQHQRYAMGGILNTGAAFNSVVPTERTKLLDELRAKLIAEVQPKLKAHEAAAKAALAAAAAGGGPVTAGAQAGLDWARTQVGKPYVWGGVGPGGYDCSGFISAIVNVMRGRNPYSRVGSTGNFPWAGFQSGYGPGLNVGAFKGDPGHMAGTIGGTNVESSGSIGVRVGGGARGANNGMFTVRAHLADTGAMLPHGQAAINLSGRTEQVLSPSATRAYNGEGNSDRVVGALSELRSDVQALQSALPGNGDTFNIYAENAQEGAHASRMLLRSMR